MNKRDYTSNIIITILPHLFGIYYTYNDLLYSFIITISTITSVLWHRTKERNNILLVLDYSTATILTLYELYSVYYTELFELTLFLNLFVLFFNKSVYFLSKRRLLNYNKWHSIYHILSSSKTTLIASFNK